MNADAWAWSDQHGEACRVLQTETLWGETLCRVWLPSRGAIAQVHAERLRPLAQATHASRAHIIYAAAAARVADGLAGNILLAPLEASILLLPHQIHALARVVAGDRVRYLLADEVGLGKTIEAGLIIRELKLRGLIRRILIVAPKGLVTQWVAEMRARFGEEFRLLVPADLTAFRRVGGDDNLWRSFDQVVCPMDSVKPLDGRRGWSADQLAAYNRERFDDLIAAGWDLVVVDEAHRLAGSTDDVAHYRLGQELARTAPALLLLSATPHQGKSDAFVRLLSLLDPLAFPAGTTTVNRELVRRYLVRTEKRKAIDADGQPLFMPRQTRLAPVAWEARHHAQSLLYDAVTEYVREGYNQAAREAKNYIGFLMILMQRLVTSSTRAIRTALERRLEALQAPDDQPTLFAALSPDDWAEADGQEQIEMLLRTRLAALRNEVDEVRTLLEQARGAELASPDAKAEALLEWIYHLQREEVEPDLKVLVFTEFVPTQEMLRAFLEARGFLVVCLNGSMDLRERGRVQQAFAADARVLVSTDAGGEGLNLQFCHVVVNYDIPWNPMRLEQRIGRVDRIGQKHTVRAINLALADTVEYRVREVLEAKLAVILKELGVDKTADMLDSEGAGSLFDTLYVQSLLHPQALESQVTTTVRLVQELANTARAGSSLLESDEVPDPAEARRLITHPLSHWVEVMATSYVEAAGGAAARRGSVWDLLWPDGAISEGVVFTAREAQEIAGAHHLTLEDPRVRRLLTTLPQVLPGQPVPRLALLGMPAAVRGLWSLWRIVLRTQHDEHHRVVPLFVGDDGRVFGAAARRVWEHLLTGAVDVRGYLAGDAAVSALGGARQAAEEYGRAAYDDLLEGHRVRLLREREVATYSFKARREAVERIGLAAVRTRRRVQLEEEERHLLARLEQRAAVYPELTAILVAQVQGTEGTGG